MKKATGDEDTQATFDISDEEFAEDILMKAMATELSTEMDIPSPQPIINQSGDSPIDTEKPTIQPSTSGDTPMNLPNSLETPPGGQPTPSESLTEAPASGIEAKEMLETAKAKIDQAVKLAASVPNPADHLQTTLDELSEDTSMTTSLSATQQQEHQLHSLRYLCNALIRNAKLAERMTRVVNTSQVTKAVNKALLMEDFNPVHLSLTQFLQHPMAAAVWTVASIHNSDFVTDSTAWGRWWMAMVESDNPKIRLQRSIYQINQFNALANATFTNFGHNPTYYTTEWLVVQLVRLGDHLMAAHIKSEFGFNWPYEYQKVASYIARNKLTEVREIFTKLDAIWPAGVRLHFHYNQPAFTDCILEFAESDAAAGKIPQMKKMRHNHDQIFGGPDVGGRTDSDVDVNDSRIREEDFQPPPMKRTRPPVARMEFQPSQFPNAPSESEEDFMTDEPRTVRSYADLLK